MHVNVEKNIHTIQFMENIPILATSSIFLYVPGEIYEIYISRLIEKRFEYHKLPFNDIKGKMIYILWLLFIIGNNFRSFEPQIDYS